VIVGWARQDCERVGARVRVPPIWAGIKAWSVWGAQVVPCWSRSSLLSAPPPVLTLSLDRGDKSHISRTLPAPFFLCRRRESTPEVCGEEYGDKGRLNTLNPYVCDVIALDAGGSQPRLRTRWRRWRTKAPASFPFPRVQGLRLKVIVALACGGLPSSGLVFSSARD
jgi:hypothetical protein